MKKFSRNYGWRTEVYTVEENGDVTHEFIDNKTGIMFKSWKDNVYTDLGWKNIKDYYSRLKDLKFKLYNSLEQEIEIAIQNEFDPPAN